MGCNRWHHCYSHKYSQPCSMMRSMTMTKEHSFGSELMEMYLTFDDSTQKQELRRCWSDIYFSLTTVHFLHTRSTTFKLLPTLSPDPHAVSDWRSVWRKQRWFISQSQEQTIHSSNHHNRQQPTESHWQVPILGQHNITECIDWRRDLGTDWQSERGRSAYSPSASGANAECG